MDTFSMRLLAKDLDSFYASPMRWPRALVAVALVSGGLSTIATAPARAIAASASCTAGSYSESTSGIYTYAVFKAPSQTSNGSCTFTPPAGVTTVELFMTGGGGGGAGGVAGANLGGGCVVSCRVIGMFRMTDEKGGDDKLLCVAAGDIRKNELQDLKDVPYYELDEIKHFFEVYKTLEPGKEVHGGDWVGHDMAQAEIEASYERYNKAGGHH